MLNLSRMLPLKDVDLDAILNITWLLLGLGAVIYLGSRTRVRQAIFRFVGVGLIVSTLFPVVSATDDIIRIQHLQQQQQSHLPGQSSSSGEHRHRSETLIRLYEAMESPLAANLVRICFTVFFIFLTIPLCEAYGRNATIKPRGRAPPVCRA